MPHHTDLKDRLFGAEELVVDICPLADAQRLVGIWHRHHGQVAGHKFSLKAVLMNRLRTVEAGVAIVGRPVSRHLDDGKTLEVTRLATSGEANVASKLLGRAAREAKRRGYKRLITYTLAQESGASLRAAGFVMEKNCTGGSWNSPTRPRVDRHPTGPKQRWAREL